jgi:hypothetical protein
VRSGIGSKKRELAGLFTAGIPKYLVSWKLLSGGKQFY